MTTWKTANLRRTQRLNDCRRRGNVDRGLADNKRQIARDAATLKRGCCELDTWVQPLAARVGRRPA
jgi:hypothetical protein